MFLQTSDTQRHLGAGAGLGQEGGRGGLCLRHDIEGVPRNSGIKTNNILTQCLKKKSEFMQKTMVNKISRFCMLSYEVISISYV